jgi:hypothetical protein
MGADPILVPETALDECIGLIWSDRVNQRNL